MSVNRINNIEFFSGGNAQFTVRYFGKHFYYQIKKPRQNMPFFIRTNSKYVGAYRPATNDIKFSPKSFYRETAEEVQALLWAFETIKKKEYTDNIFHAGKCCRCGRFLSTPESVANGIGPECDTKSREERKEKMKKEFDPFNQFKAAPQSKEEPKNFVEAYEKGGVIEIPENIQLALQLFS